MPLDRLMLASGDVTEYSHEDSVMRENLNRLSAAVLDPGDAALATLKSALV